MSAYMHTPKCDDHHTTGASLLVATIACCGTTANKAVQIMRVKSNIQMLTSLNYNTGVRSTLHREW